MARLGISLYPEHSTLEKDKAYVTLAGAHQLGGGTQGCAGAGTGGDAVIEQHLPCCLLYTSYAAG